MKYRADIDGLRSIAVIPVVLYHAGLSLFGGGFVGVDVFFVISGYLITGILLGSLANDSFSIADFYRRRVRRIFPALLLVLVATLCAAWIFFTPARMIEFGRSLGFVSIFSSNFHFWKAVDYFSTNAHVQPLLHTWSLAVEEQFYIFYPILLYFVSKTRLTLHLVLLVIGSLSFVAACVIMAWAPSAVFYMLPTRAWELVIGGLIACGFPKTSDNIRTNSVAAFTGIALILIPVIFYDSATPFPGLAALPPTLGAALLIWSGSSNTSPIHGLLSTKPFVLVGQASYSFYLWHFPIFAFAAYLYGGEFDVRTGLLLSLVALLASLATLKWLETPVRRSKSRLAVVLPVAGMALAGLAGLLISQSDGYPSRLSPDAASYAEVANDKNRHHGECMSVGTVIVPPSKACILGNRRATPTALLWGDSHAMVTSAAMESAALRHGSAFLFAAAADCPVGIGFAISTATATELTTTPAYRYCAQYNREMLQLALAEPSISDIVLSSRWTNWRVGEPGNAVETPVDIRLRDELGTATSANGNAAIFERGFEKLLETLIRAGKTVHIVGPLPEPSFDVPQMLFVAQYGLVDQPSALTVKAFEARHSKIMVVFMRLERQHDVHIILPHSELCDSSKCAIVENNEAIYFDHNHLSVYGAKKTSKLYEQIFDEE